MTETSGTDTAHTATSGTDSSDTDTADTGTLHGVMSADWTPDAPLVLAFFHGYGATEHDLAPLGPMLALTVPWVSLRAPLPMGSRGYAWYPFFGPGDPDPSHATEAVWQWIGAHLAPDSKVAAVGFSQGGLIASQLLRTRPERIAATVMLSGYVQPGPQPADERLAAGRPAVFWGRGDRDRLITADAVERASRWLPAHSALTERVYPGLAHGISDQEIDDVRAFLIGRLYGRLPTGGIPRGGTAGQKLSSFAGESDLKYLSSCSRRATSAAAARLISALRSLSRPGFATRLRGRPVPVDGTCDR